MYRNIITKLMITALTMILVGCSGGGNTPVNPAPPVTGQTDSEPVVYISESINEGASLPMVFGIYDVTLDPVNMTGDIRPIRNLSALGDSVMVDVTPFLSITPCANCMRIKSIGLSPENYIEVTFQTKHPFEPGKRLDLHVFDPRGIIVTGYNPSLFSRLRIDLDGDGTFESPAEGNVDLVVNADGYTSFYDAVVEDFTGYNVPGNISPFKNLWFDPATTTPDSNYDPAAAPKYGFTDLTVPKGHNVFPMGGGFDNPLASTTYQFNLTDTANVNFLFIFEASYGVTSTRFTRQEPRYFLPEFHRKEALSASATISASNLVAFDSSPSLTASLQISVVDWQAGITPTENWDYATSNLTAIQNRSDVKNIVIDLPGVLQNMVGLVSSDRTSGDGTIASPYIWDLQFSNELGAGAGKYWGLVAVRDDLEGSENAPLGVSSDVTSPVKMHDLTVYQPFSVTIAEGTNIPPVADVDAAPSPVYANEDVTVSVGSNCMDPDGNIVKYEYDFDYAPGDFVDDIGYTQLDTDSDFGDPFTYSYNDTQLGSHFIAQRVTDNLGATNIDSVEVIVNSYTNELPVADVDAAPSSVYVNTDVTVSVGINCQDPDGSIVKYEYDFYYDVGAFVPDDTYTQVSADSDFGDPFTIQYTTEGTYNIAQRVTDDGDATDIDYITVEVTEVPNQSPVAEVLAVPSSVYTNADVTISVGPLCNDPDGQIITYEYDFDYQVGNFEAQYTQQEIDPNFGDPFTHQYATAGTYVIAQKVTDNQSATAIDTATVEVTVIPNDPPIADVHATPDPVRVCANLTATVGPSCDDPDGSIIRYEYDFYWSGVVAEFDPDPAYTQETVDPDFGLPVVHQYLQGETGQHLVAQRVTDNLGATDIDQDSIIVNANSAPIVDLADNQSDFNLNVGEQVIFSPGPTTDDPDGVITLYEYDWNYSVGTFTMDASNTTGVPISHQFNTVGTFLVAIRVTDDGCPNLQAIDYDTYIVSAVSSGLPINENFEGTTVTNIPLDWAVIGKFGQSYYLDTPGQQGQHGCSNNTWRWGVTVNTGQSNDPANPTETHFLNENGYANGSSDPAYTYENRATIACTPLFTVPSTGATLTVRHKWNMAWMDASIIGYPHESFDGGRPIISDDLTSHPTTVSWSDFCYNTTGSSYPINPPLTVVTGPAYGTVSNYTCPVHPLWMEPAHVDDSPTANNGWTTNTYTIPAGYAGQKVRIGFLFGSEDYDISNDICTYASENQWGATIYDGFGWRIQKMSIVAN